MRTKSVALNYTCNHACTFCTIRRPSDDAAFIAHAAVKARIAEAGEVPELVLTGGEPTLRRDLLALVRSAPAAAVTLETNATLIDEARVVALREAGVAAIRAHVPALGRLLATITRDDDAPRAVERGLRAIVSQRMTLDVAIPIVRSNLDAVARLPSELAAMLGPRSIRTLILRVPHAAADEREVCAYNEVVPVLQEVTADARAVSIAVKLAADSGPPPCVFPALRRPTQLYSLTGRAGPRDELFHPAACERCRVRESCPGIARDYVSRFGLPSMTPITEDRARRRLSLIHTVEEQIARELTAPGGRSREAGVPDEEIIRVNFHCNQACDFCYVSTHLPLPADDLVEHAIQRALDAGRPIVISGGEPTLNPRIVEYLELARRSPYPVELQTNAVRLEDPALARVIAAAGIGRAFVSLHGATAATSDAVTRAPGTFEKTLRGIDNLHALGVPLRLNFVVCRSNAPELPAMIELAAQRWSGASVSISFVAQSTDVVPRDRELMPRYSEVVPHIAAAFAVGALRSVEIVGFESMCGLPLCIVPDAVTRSAGLPAIEDSGGGEFVKPEPCGACALSDRCYGIRRGYVDAYGYDELRPVTQP